MKRDNLIYIPYSNKQGNYITNMVSVCSKFGPVLPPETILKKPTILLQTKAVFLNWVEVKSLPILYVVLSVFKITGVKMIWVFHNKIPHDETKIKAIEKRFRFIEENCDKILLLSKNSRTELRTESGKEKAIYLPHINYVESLHLADIDLHAKYHIPNDAFVYLFSGQLRPYKNLELLIEIMNELSLKNSYLIIAGNPDTTDYGKDILKLINENPRIICDMRNIPDDLLNTYMKMSDVVVCPYNKISSMNSGVVILAFSNKKTVIVPDIAMAQDFEDEGICYVYKYDVNNQAEHKAHLKETMLHAYNMGKDYNKSLGEKAYKYVSENNSAAVVEKILASEILNIE